MKQIKIWWLFAVGFAGMALCALLLAGAWLQGAVLGLMGAFMLAVMAAMCKKCLRRSMPANRQEALQMLGQAAAFIATVAVSATDMGTIKLLPGWWLLLGLALLVFAYILFVQAMLAQPRHAADAYGEPKAEEKAQGPYELLRHPCMTAMLLGYLGLPLFFSSALGFIPAAVGAVLTIMRVVTVEDHRVRSYAWYPEYTKQVSYRVIPFIW